MTESLGTAIAVEMPVDVTNVNLNVEPNFDSFNGNASKYELKAESVCLETAKEFVGNKKYAALAQQQRADAFKAFVSMLAITKAIKVGKGGKNGEWGDFLEKLTSSGLSLKRRTADRWIVKAVFGEKPVGVPGWVVKKLESLRHEVLGERKPAPAQKIEISPKSCQERAELLVAMQRLENLIGEEGVFQVIYDAIVEHPSLTEPTLRTGGTEQQSEPRAAIPGKPERLAIAFLEDDPEPVCDTLAGQMEAQQSNTRGATE